MCVCFKKVSCFNGIKSDSPFEASVVLSITVYSFTRQSALVLTVHYIGRIFVYCKAKLRTYMEALDFICCDRATWKSHYSRGKIDACAFGGGGGIKASRVAV